MNVGEGLHQLQMWDAHIDALLRLDLIPGAARHLQHLVLLLRRILGVLRLRRRGC